MRLNKVLTDIRELLDDHHACDNEDTRVGIVYAIRVVERKQREAGNSHPLPDEPA